VAQEGLAKAAQVWAAVALVAEAGVVGVTSGEEARGAAAAASAAAGVEVAVTALGAAGVGLGWAVRAAAAPEARQ
jgi:hydrogenase/urease accessory protein HupE